MALALASLSVVVLLLASSLHLTTADVYLHNPRGSNNRLNEASANRANNDRLFDSQNNNRGGVNVGEESATGKDSLGQLRFFEGSLLPIEWTAQHSCGAAGGKARCNIVIQYMCDASWTKPSPGSTRPLRDGTSINTPNLDDSDPSTGLHESPQFYTLCNTRERNKGLFTADQTLKGNTAKYTRQNPNGDRSGLECPEERDYYPYWHTSPWVDIAVLTSNTSLCPMYKAESQNVKGKGSCRTDPTKNNPAACPLDEQRVTGWSPGVSWQGHGRTVPTVDCLEAQFSRDNHLGNSDNLLPMTYMWKIPSVTEACEENVAACRCVLRLRYNISTGDYDDWNTTSSSNGNRDVRDGQPSPVTQVPHHFIPLSTSFAATNQITSAMPRFYSFYRTLSSIPASTPDFALPSTPRNLAALSKIARTYLRLNGAHQTFLLPPPFTILTSVASVVISFRRE